MTGQKWLETGQKELKNGQKWLRTGKKLLKFVKKRTRKCKNECFFYEKLANNKTTLLRKFLTELFSLKSKRVNARVVVMANPADHVGAAPFRGAINSPI